METVEVRSDLHLTLVSAEVPVVVPVALEYRSTDPFAVSVVFFAGADEVRWLLARDLLDEGLVHEVGEGDVQVLPAVDEFSRPVVQIRLESPGGVAILEAPTDEVLDFLARSYALVPPGMESQHLGLDHAITRLLAA
jgi:hypothetical protein